jgi:hypothetical protein
MDGIPIHLEPATRLDPLPRAIRALVVLSHECGPNEAADFVSSASEGSLAQWGIGPEDLEWLVNIGYVEPAEARHVQSTRQTAQNGRRGRETPVMITEAGSRFLEQVFAAVALDSAFADGAQSIHEVPHWDGQELRFHGVLVKRFQRPARNQERLLDKFESQCWARCVENPLPGAGEISPTDQLRDAVKRLNRSLQVPLIRFGGDGTGTGVYWRRLASGRPEPLPHGFPARPSAREASQTEVRPVFTPSSR